MKLETPIHSFIDFEAEEYIRDSSIEEAKHYISLLLNKKEEDIDFDNFVFLTELISKVHIQPKKKY